MANYSTVCVCCGEGFNMSNPCWNDDGVDMDAAGVITHLNGVCKVCSDEARDFAARWTEEGY